MVSMFAAITVCLEVNKDGQFLNSSGSETLKLIVLNFVKIDGYQKGAW